MTIIYFVKEEFVCEKLDLFLEGCWSRVIGLGISQLKFYKKREFLWVFLSIGEVLALVDHLHLVSSCLIVLYGLVVV